MTSNQLIRKQASLRTLLVDRVRDLIIGGELAPGENLVERDLVERFGVSRTLLREALQQLHGEGLIVSVLHRGPSVATISEQDARQIYAVRALLESQAGRDFVENATDEEIEELGAVTARLRTAEVRLDPNLQLLAKNQFYEILLTVGGNSTIADILTTLNNRVTMLRRISLAHPGRLEQTVSELEEIVESARRRDADKVAALLQAHVEHASALALASFA